jgi:AraC-like DNA-binding protein
VGRVPARPSADPTSRREAALAELRDLVRRSATREGEQPGLYPGLGFDRVSQPASLRKSQTLGPNLCVVVQGRKLSAFGDVELSYDSSRYLIVTGEAEYLGRVTEATAQRPYLAICMHIDPEVIARTLLGLVDHSAVPVPETAPAFVSALDAPIADCLVRLLRACDDPLERELVAPLVVQELAFRLLRSDAAAALRSAVGGDRDADRIRLAMRFLQDSVERPLSVEDVARHVAMSPSHFAHRFRAVARLSPMRYLKQLRLQHGRNLLLSGLRVGEAAARCGYESSSHFARDFKALFGASPAEYTRHLRST